MDYIGFIALYWGLTERGTPPEVLWPWSLGCVGVMEELAEALERFYGEFMVHVGDGYGLIPDGDHTIGERGGGL